MDCKDRCKSIFVDIDVMTSYLCQLELNHDGDQRLVNGELNE